MNTPRRQCLTALSSLVAGLASAPRLQAGETVAQVRISPAQTPVAQQALSAEWLRIETPMNGNLLAAVARPKGKGPFPALLVAHGSHGFAREYVVLAREISTQGFMVVVACWLRGGIPDGGDVSEPIDCPEARATTIRRACIAESSSTGHSTTTRCAAS